MVLWGDANRGATLSLPPGNDFLTRLPPVATVHPSSDYERRVVALRVVASSREVHVMSMRMCQLFFVCRLLTLT